MLLYYYIICVLSCTTNKPISIVLGYHHSGFTITQSTHTQYEHVDTSGTALLIRTKNPATPSHGVTESDVAGIGAETAKSVRPPRRASSRYSSSAKNGRKLINPGAITLIGPFSSRITSSLIHPTGDLSALVTRCNHSRCPFISLLLTSSPLSSLPPQPRADLLLP